MTNPTCKARTEQKEKYMKKKEITVLPCPKCGSGLLARGKPFRSTTPRLIVMLGKMHGVCCVICGHYEPTVKAWNRARRGQNEKNNG